MGNTEGALTKCIFRENVARSQRKLQDERNRQEYLQNQDAGNLFLVLCTAPVQPMFILPILKCLMALKLGERILEEAVLAGSAGSSVGTVHFNLSPVLY